MSRIQEIKTVLTKMAFRRRLQRAWRGAWHGLLGGGLCWLLSLILFKIFPLPAVTLAFGGIAGAICVLTGFLVGWSQNPSVLETARWVDMRQNLKERISTAIEITQTKQSSAWQDLVIGDASKSVGQIDPKRMLPYHLPRSSRWVLLVLALGAGLGFVPEYRSKDYVRQQQEAEVIQDTGRRLAELTRRSLQQRPPALEPTRTALDSVVELGEHLAKARLTRNDALKDLASVTDKLKEQAKELGNKPAVKSLERAARSPNKGGSPGFAELQKRIEALQSSLANQTADSEVIEKLKQNLQRAKEAAAGMPSGDSSEARAAQEQLSQSLANISKEARDLGISLPSLEEAIAALAAAETERLIRDLDIAEMDLEKLQQMAKALENLQLKAEKMGKDLPEQLENGQAAAAKATLEKMSAELMSESVDPVELARILDEVSRSIEPADPYGEASSHLKEASDALKSGKRRAAAESLAKAAKELDDLLQQLKDVEALMASLDALQRAQVSIGNGQCWGSSKGPPKGGEGGGTGAGVGTWADDSRWLELGEIRDRWDNSGVVRPDQESRGVSDRGDGQLADNLAPTKIKGQINPGESMPSITLKGVSIKGMSKVDFKEVVTAAQAEAQSALNQDQVPRAYRGAVRDYFDDQKN